MRFLRLLAVILSCILISAHFQRGGYSGIAVLCLLSPGLLIFNRIWAVRITQTLLVVYAAEWLRTILHLVQLRMDYGMPWLRLGIILGTVVLFTLASAFWLNRLPVKNPQAA